MHMLLMAMMAMIHLPAAHLLAMFVLATAAVTLPPAAKVVMLIAVIYPLIQGLKKVPALAPHILGWKAIALNVALCTLGLFYGPTAIPPDQLYTANTLFAVIYTAMGAAGIHGTMNVMATTPEPPDSTEAKK